MSVTLKDIALVAGVSVGTVDRALNNRGRINAEVAERVRSIAKQMNYRTNTVAKSLAIRNKNLTIAVVLHVQQNEFFGEVEDGLRRAQNEIRDFGITVKVYHCRDFDPADQLAQINNAVEDGAAGLILVPIEHPDITSKITQLKQEGLPVVFLTALLDNVSCFSAVHCDYPRSGRIAARLIDMISGGHGSVMIFSPSFTMFGHRQRVESFVKYIADKKSELHLIKIVELPNDSFGTYRITLEQLREYAQVDNVVFCGNTEAVVRAIEECGRKINTVVYDFSPAAKSALLENHIDVALQQSPAEQGYRAVMILFDYLTSKKIPASEILVENKIIFKECID